jgi:hypothetical protein
MAVEGPRLQSGRNPRGVAQLAEHRSPKPGVAGSSPAAPVGQVKPKPALLGGFWCLFATSRVLRPRPLYTAGRLARLARGWRARRRRQRLRMSMPSLATGGDDEPSRPCPACLPPSGSTRPSTPRAAGGPLEPALGHRLGEPGFVRSRCWAPLTATARQSESSMRREDRPGGEPNARARRNSLSPDRTDSSLMAVR